LSNGSEALISRITALGPSAKRPPHIRLEPDMPRLPLLSLTAAFALVLAGCDRESADTAQPEGNAGAEADLTGKVDRSFAGDAMPAAELADPDGKKLQLASLQGKPTLVNLWATWCVPCITEMPLLDELAGELGDSVQVVTVSEDIQGAEKVVPFFADKKFANLPQWMDTPNTLPPAFNANSLPLTVLYGADGKELWRVTGGYDWSSAEARELIAEASPS
jgi:thiol-disulfide isomerase/thioredoxin